MNTAKKINPWIIAISGASGTIYGRRLIDLLENNFSSLQIEVVVSESAARVMREEEGIKFPTSRVTAKDLIGRESDRIRFHSNEDIGALIASGSYVTSGMVICPASMKTVAGVSVGYGNNLIERAADVTLKERRNFIIVPRETPFSEIHLENLLRIMRLGGKVVPAMPGFYNNPSTIMDIVDHLVLKIMDQMGFDPEDLKGIAPRWKEERDQAWNDSKKVTSIRARNLKSV